MLETSGLACERGGLRLFSQLGFVLTAGELLRVRGANGAGKTTLLRTLAGLTRAAAGTIRWRGDPIGDEYRSEMLFLGHAPAVKDELTVLENLQFAARLSGLEEGNLDRALQQLGIARLAGLPARFLSQGQRKRVALARLALSADKPLWLLDEPYSALDAGGIDCVSELCAAHLAGGGMVVLTSHQDVDISGALERALELGS
ncbi:MAG: cytochrome c biogenesis heme-transporting ATPase CcmA [Burkholderiales bacterium]